MVPWWGDWVPPDNRPRNPTWYLGGPHVAAFVTLFILVTCIKTLNKAIEANSPGPRLLSLGGKDLRHSMACHRLYLGDRQSSWEQSRVEMKSPQRQAQALYAGGLTGLREGT